MQDRRVLLGPRQTKRGTCGRDQPALEADIERRCAVWDGEDDDLDRIDVQDRDRLDPVIAVGDDVAAVAVRDDLDEWERVRSMFEVEILELVDPLGVQMLARPAERISMNQGERDEA